MPPSVSVSIDEEYYRERCTQGEVNLCGSFAVLLVREGRREEAKEWYRKACDQSPWGEHDYVYGCFSLGVILESEGRINEARALMRKPCDHGQQRECFQWALFEKRHNNIAKYEELGARVCETSEPLDQTSTPFHLGCSTMFDHFLTKGDTGRAKAYMDRICAVKALEFVCVKQRRQFEEVAQNIYAYRAPEGKGFTSISVYNLRKYYYLITENAVKLIRGKPMLGKKGDGGETAVNLAIEDPGPFVLASDHKLTFSVRDLDKSRVEYRPKLKQLVFHDAEGKRIKIMGWLGGHPGEVVFVRSISNEKFQERYLLVRWAADQECEYPCCQKRYSLMELNPTPRYLLGNSHECQFRTA